MEEIKINTEYIKLDQFLKFSGVVQTGGEASFLISDGMVKLNDEVCTMRGKKLYPKDIIEIENHNSFIVI